MGKAPTPEPSEFSKQITAYIRHQLEIRDADVSGRWLARNTSMSPSYAFTRLSGSRPFNSNDLGEIADLFEISPHEMLHAAVVHWETTEGERFLHIEWRPGISVVPDRTSPPDETDGRENKLGGSNQTTPTKGPRHRGSKNSESPP